MNEHIFGYEVKANCHVCGGVELQAADITLTIHPDPEKSRYSFKCEGCGDLVVKPAPAVVIELLTRASVKTVRITIPAEVLERDAIYQPPLNNDDLLDLMLALEAEPTTPDPR